MRNLKILAIAAMFIIVVTSIVFSIIYYRRDQKDMLGICAFIACVTVAILGPFVSGAFDKKK